MNILHIISAPASGGAEVYVKDLAKQLSSDGHNVHIAFLSNAEDINRDVAYGKNFLADLEYAGICTFIIGNETRRKPWLGAIKIRRYIRKNNIDICHTHLAYGIIFSSLSSIPVIYTHHTIQPRWGKLTYSIFNKLVDRYVGISEKCSSALAGYTNRQVTTINNAVAEEKFKDFMRVREHKSPLFAVMVGRITPEKDYINLFKALSLLDERLLKDINFFIAGEGSEEYKKVLFLFIEKYKLSNHVEFVGNIQNIPKFLYEADLFVMSSASEGLPIALTEAAVSGLPCIVTDVGGCSEVIGKSDNGALVPPNNPRALATEIERFISDSSLINTYSKNAVLNSHRYSIKGAAKLHVDLYQSLI